MSQIHLLLRAEDFKQWILWTCCFTYFFSCFGISKFLSKKKLSNLQPAWLSPIKFLKNFLPSLLTTWVENWRRKVASLSCLFHFCEFFFVLIGWQSDCLSSKISCYQRNNCVLVWFWKMKPIVCHWIFIVIQNQAI